MNSNIEQKLKNLLHLAKNAATDGEAAAAAAQAAKIAEKYRIEIATLDGIGEVEERTVKAEDPLFSAMNNIHWKVDLASYICMYNGCKMLIWSTYKKDSFGETKRIKEYLLFGKPSDIQVVRYLFAYLSVELIRLSKQVSKGKGKSFSNSYLRGAVQGVKEQLKTAQQEAREGISTTALVKIDKRLADAKAEMNRLFSNNKKITSTGVINDANAYNRGMADGRNVHLGKSLNGGRLLPQGSK